jgi:RNA polymerase sigma-70 factor (ECF subfamily)
LAPDPSPRATPRIERGAEPEEPEDDDHQDRDSRVRKRRAQLLLRAAGEGGGYGRALLRAGEAGVLLRSGGEGGLLPLRREPLRLQLMSDPAHDVAPPAWQSLRSELVRFVRGRLADPAAADDVVHDVLLRTLEALEGPEPPVHLRGWLFRATRNAIVDHYRSRRPVEELPEEIPEVRSEAPSLGERDLTRCLEPLVAALPPAYGRALQLAEVEGLTQGELARREGISLSGAKSRVQRARRMLRDSLLACCRIELDRRGGVVDHSCRQSGAPCGGAPGSTREGCA